MKRDLIKDPIRLGIIGCGSFMQRRILPAVPAVPAIRVVNLQKRDADAAAKVAEQFGVPRSCSSRDELLADPEVEAVLIGSLNHLHEEDALACAAAGKHTLCEKPLAPTGDQAQRMVDAFDNAGLHLLVGQSLRFKPAILRAKELLDSGKLGELKSLGAFYSFLQPEGAWRLDWNVGAGATQDLGVHLIDMIRFVSGQEIECVSAMLDGKFDPAGGRADRTVRAIFWLSGGAIATMGASLEESYHHGFDVIGDKASLHGWASMRQTHEPGETLRLLTEEGATELRLGESNVYEDELAHFASVLAGEDNCLIPATEGLANQRVIDAIYRSAQERCEVEIANPAS
jgi:predicted dehydrogenase